MLLTGHSVCALAQSTEIPLDNGGTIVWLGGTFVERAQSYGLIELALTALASPEKPVPVFRNLGWSADTVFAESRGIFDSPEKGYERLLAHLEGLSPTTVFVAYGANESFAGPDGLPRFRDGLQRLLRNIEALGANPVLVTPHRHEQHPSPLPDVTANNRRLEQYGSEIAAIARQRHLPCFDLSKVITEKIIASPQTDNGIHLNVLGYRKVGDRIARAAFPSSSAARIIVERDESASSTGVSVSGLARSDKRVEFEAKIAHLPWFDTILSVRDLDPGNYAIRVGTRHLTEATAAELAKGIVLQSGPDVEQLETLRQLIVDKNRLYFLKWRPQNITYLTGFRKHEQGQNAKEVDELIPLIENLESRIDSMRHPVENEYSITRIGSVVNRRQK